ncbi:hypothetical protein BDV96DRAFT_576643 [Lophiotrema nucula]|uniref:Uncharacterized protein n=1 Tax=Lophiotrema nucula TaxID=690887 RepID=A0A6A5Z4J7_9PLEO|nr:hypothetical protein BDV96DRAFT_576643 [Lophiotrema nucula]
MSYQPPPGSPPNYQHDNSNPWADSTTQTQQPHSQAQHPYAQTEQPHSQAQHPYAQSEQPWGQEQHQPYSETQHPYGQTPHPSEQAPGLPPRRSGTDLALPQGEERSEQIETLQAFEASKPQSEDDKNQEILQKEFPGIDGSLIAAIYGDSQSLSATREMLQELASGA